ncbi:hypothetical protein F443_18502 [Phytophthora nicotianae P1569]|uniref:Uncharacterized protein n=1 Tax=Phytophthora nicotianae P1569 TaxID=1317065 RepID=V9E7N8_PHYNI|nr:hypothetical protein F443_18502 [Phytophthora nicotianae P1569]
MSPLVGPSKRDGVRSSAKHGSDDVLNDYHYDYHPAAACGAWWPPHNTNTKAQRTGDRHVQDEKHVCATAAATKSDFHAFFLQTMLSDVVS